MPFTKHDRHWRSGRRFSSQPPFLADLLAATAASSFWIRSTGGFSWIHLISVFVLLFIPVAIYRVRAGDVRGHMQAVRGLYAGLVIAGLFAVIIPGRTLGQLFL